MSALTVLMSAYYFSNLNIFLENYDLKVYTNHAYVMLVCYMWTQSQTVWTQVIDKLIEDTPSVTCLF